MVHVAGRSQGRPDPFFDQGRHLDHVLPFGGARFDGIAGPDHRGGFRRHLVDPHVAGAARVGCRGAGLVKAHRPEPLVDSRRLEEVLACAVTGRLFPGDVGLFARPRASGNRGPVELPSGDAHRTAGVGRRSGRPDAALWVQQLGQVAVHFDPPAQECLHDGLNVTLDEQRTSGAICHRNRHVRVGEVTGVYVEAARRGVDVGIECGGRKRSLGHDEVDPDGSHSPPAGNATTHYLLRPRNRSGGPRSTHSSLKKGYFGTWSYYDDRVTQPISNSDVAHVARLARLALSEEELSRYTTQLAAVLEHAADIASLDIEGVPPTAHPFPLANVFREDVPRPCLDRDEVLSQAPDVEDDRFRIPRILGEAP